jgi:hypothetical protein
MRTKPFPVLRNPAIIFGGFADSTDVTLFIPTLTDLNKNLLFIS